MAAEEKSAEVVVAAKGDELGGRAPEMSAAATGVEEWTRDVGKLAGRVTKFNLNPSAKEFAPFCRLKSSELNDNVVVATGSFSLWMSTGVLLADAPGGFVPDPRLDDVEQREMTNDRRMDRYRQMQEDCISRTVYITDIDGNVTEEYLAGVFSSYGIVTEGYLAGVFSTYRNNDARATLGLGGTLLGFFRIYVFPSKMTIMPINPYFLPN